MVERIHEDRHRFSARITTGIGHGLRVVDDVTSHKFFTHGTRGAGTLILFLRGSTSSLSSSDIKIAGTTIVTGILAKNILSHARRRFSKNSVENSSA